MNTYMTAERIEKIYSRFEEWIRKLVSKFVSQFGGDWQEMFAEANYLFVLHCHTWNHRRGELSKHISYRIWMGLLDRRRRDARHHAKTSTHVNTREHEPSYTQSPLIDFIDSLTEDAKVIAKAILYPTLDLDLLLSSHGGLRATYRALREFFAEWDEDRLYTAFFDLEDAVCPNQHHALAPALAEKPLFK